MAMFHSFSYRFAGDIVFLCFVITFLRLVVPSESYDALMESHFLTGRDAFYTGHGTFDNVVHENIYKFISELNQTQ